MGEILDLIFGILGAVTGGIITVLVGPWVAEKFKIRENYIVPFREWCTEFYGNLNEFDYRYTDKNKGNLDKLSDIQIILDYRSLHDCLIDSHKWLGKISKENEDVSDLLTKLEEVVDGFWHHLEDQHPDKLPSVGDVKEFNRNIKLLSRDDRKEIADKIRAHLSLNIPEYSSKNFRKIREYLIDMIP